jgi:hypothetical protein
MKNLLPTLLFICLAQGSLQAQENYCNFEGTIKSIYFGNALGYRTGTLDSAAVNPMPNVVNMSTLCAKYTRDTATYDYLKMFTFDKMVDITPYATNAGTPPKMKIKLYTSAPVGTVVLLQLGIKSVDNFPTGIHSEYVAQTIVQNAWQELSFNWDTTYSTSMAQPTDIDKMVLLFAPGTNSTTDFYIDDITGPALVTSGMSEQTTSVKLLQNNPNPARENTSISFQMSSAGFVSLKIYDLMGNVVGTIAEQHMKAGVHTIPVETINMAGGIYFYVLKSQGVTRTRKMVIDK